MKSTKRRVWVHKYNRLSAVWWTHSWYLIDSTTRLISWYFHFGRVHTNGWRIKSYHYKNSWDITFHVSPWTIRFGNGHY